MNVTTESGLQVVLERQRPEVANANGEGGTVTPAAYGGPVMGPWGANGGVPTTPWQGWPVDWNTGWFNGSPQLGMRAGVASTCADLNSRQLASFPTYCIKGETMVASPSWTGNPEPSLYSDWSEAAKQMSNSLWLRGECFLYATGRFRSTKQIARWAVINPDNASVRAEDGALVYRLGTDVIGVRYPGQPVNEIDVLHLKHQTWPGYLRGIGALEWTAANVMGLEALQSYMANLAIRGGVPWAILRHPTRLNETQSSDLQNAWVNASARRDGAPAVLSGGIELDVLTLSPKDMALLDLDIWNSQMICAAFGVPAYLVNLEQPGNLTYANSRDLFSFHWRATLRPHAQTIANGLSAWALPMGTRIEFNPDRYTQPELSERAATYAVLFNIVDPQTGERAISIPEIRAMERFQPADPPTATELTSQMVDA